MERVSTNEYMPENEEVLLVGEIQELFVSNIDRMAVWISGNYAHDISSTPYSYILAGVVGGSAGEQYRGWGLTVWQTRLESNREVIVCNLVTDQKKGRLRIELVDGKINIARLGKPNADSVQLARYLLPRTEWDERLSEIEATPLDLRKKHF